ncbi:hypothetical protein DL240_16525 [Lujinxingia litoralis]|uniref:Uncharacterized protein n=1 Tax=Lujinxingia litoralis TaxID=2211119 RepID=A0A328C3X8_9DELT|nr:hypothetical protein [Lujinxingia litoralis]RAL20636.1 hypothetical protein DL240_16525 [Lujinxingia litoralis]
MLKRLLLSALLVSGLSLTTMACSGDSDDDNTPVVDAGNDTGNVEEDTGDVDEDTGDVEEDTGDVDEDAGDVEEDAGDDTHTGELENPDITAESCEEIEATTCFSNGECAESEVCFDVSRGSGVACCVPGTRGTLEPGDDCSPTNGQLECASGLCLQFDTAEGEVSVCSADCTEDAECPEVLPYCSPFLGVCSPPPAE